MRSTALHRLQQFLVQALALMLLWAFASCTSEDLRIKQDFPFEVTVMPVPKEVANGQTVEIRVAIAPSGDFSGTDYFIRYFQYDGKGTLRCYDDPAYEPNDSYELPSKEFRLYYTSLSAVSQSFDIWISDSFGNEKSLKFQFNNSD